MSGALSWIVPNGKVALHHAPKTVRLSRRKAAVANGGETSVSLAELCERTTPKTCQLNPLLFNGHLQTCCTVVYKEHVPVYYKRRVFEADTSINYPGSYAVDFVVPPYEKKASKPGTGTEQNVNGGSQKDAPTESTPLFEEDDSSELPERTSYFTEAEFKQFGSSDDTTPMLVVLHGLSGGSHEIYVRHILKPLCYEHKWEACVVNSRGCAQSKVTTPLMYNARATWDARQTIQWLRKMYPKRPLFGIGFSLGANILANYVGEEGDACPLKSAIFVSNPWNLEAGSMALQRTLIGREAYSRTMAENMKKLFVRHAEMISKHKRVHPERVMKIKYLHEFDRELQGPVWGYPTETAYYRDASSTEAIFAMRIPFLIVHAEDDPISQKECLPYSEVKTTPYGVMCTSSWGGHLGWFQAGGKRWVTEPVVNYLTALAEEIDLEAPIDVPTKSTDPIDIAKHPMPEVPEPGTSVIDAVATSTGTEAFEGPELVYEPMKRRLAMPHLAHKPYQQ